MKGGRLFATVLAAVLAGGAALGLHGGSAAQPACDRACLVGVMQRYVDSLPTHSAADLPLAPNVKFTEQAARIPIGDGLWVSATQAPTTFKIFAADPTSGQVGFFGMMKQWDTPVLLAARLKLEDGRITEIENVIASDLRPQSLANLQTPRPGLLADVPASQRTPRNQMYKAAFAYFDSIEQDDGSVAPFADDCVRHENGLQTTSNKRPGPSPLAAGSPGAAALEKMGALGCAAGISTGGLQYITMIRPRHLLIIDEQKGLVFGFPRFVHRGDVRVEKIRGVPGVASMPMSFGPIDLQASEMFKVTGGKIHEIEASGFLNAYMAPTGWDAEYPETYQYGTTHPQTHPNTVPTAYPFVP